MGNQQRVHGFKVFNPDWTCRDFQYACPGKFEMEGKIELCKRGMHFCENALGCFEYYEFNPENKVAEVIAYGDIDKGENKSCTNKLEIVREITWEEVLQIVNVGINCSGKGNTGNDNSGDFNTGSRNTGSWNTGERNRGNFNAGRLNDGNGNTGSENTGNENTGNRNMGSLNVGNDNKGSGNTGNHNIGHYNTGDWNKSHHNTGYFMTEKTKIMFFNKPSDWTRRRWEQSRAKNILDRAPGLRVKWIDGKDITEEEKKNSAYNEATGGFLDVTIGTGKNRQDWWDGLNAWEKREVKSLPNFDPDIFYECTGIRVKEDGEE